MTLMRQRMKIIMTNHLFTSLESLVFKNVYMPNVTNPPKIEQTPKSKAAS